MTDEFDTSGPGNSPAARGAESGPEPTFQGGDTPVGDQLGEATIVEPAPPPVYEAAVSPVGPRPRLSARVRWGVALGVVALVVGLSTAAFALLSGGGSLSTLAGWMPADTYAYGEVRLDLPGDQHQAVADLLSHFPGFADESSLDQKVTEVLDRLIADASSGKASYSDIKPWLGDSAAFAAHGTLDAATKTGQALVAVSITNAAAARDWISKHDTDTANETTETYNGAQVTLRTAPNGEKAALTVLDTVILAGDEASVKAAIDFEGRRWLRHDRERQGRGGDDRRHAARLHVHGSPQAHGPGARRVAEHWRDAEPVGHRPAAGLGRDDGTGSERRFPGRRVRARGCRFDSRDGADEHAGGAAAGLDHRCHRGARSRIPDPAGARQARAAGRDEGHREPDPAGVVVDRRHRFAARLGRRRQHRRDGA